MLSKEVSSTIFKVFGMTRPGTEPRSLELLANTQLTRPILMLPCVIIQYPACLICLTSMVCEMGFKWLYSCCFVVDFSRICSKLHATSSRSSHLVFSPGVSLVQEVQLYSNIDTATIWMNYRFILSKRSDFYIVVNLWIAVHALPWHRFE